MEAQEIRESNTFSGFFVFWEVFLYHSGIWETLQEYKPNKSLVKNPPHMLPHFQTKVFEVLRTDIFFLSCSRIWHFN